jgi:quercetin dioxygenase-like cupin family protein
MPAEAAQKPFILRGDECANGSPYSMIGNTLRTKLAISDANGSVTVMENTVSAHNGPPFHVHPFEESFYILEGAFLFEINGSPLNATPGDFVHVPSNVPHVFQNTTDRDARYLIVIRPGGIEKFFAECAAHAVNNPNDLATMNALGENYGVKILGPPIAARKK